jgi:hypothetical protein
MEEILNVVHPLVANDEPSKQSEQHKILIDTSEQLEQAKYKTTASIDDKDMQFYA